MERTIVLTPRTIGRLKNMTADERRLMLETMLADDVLCTEREKSLTPVQELIYLMFHDAVLRDSHRYEASQLAATSMVS